MTLTTTDRVPRLQENAEHEDGGCGKEAREQAQVYVVTTWEGTQLKSGRTFVLC